MRQISIDFSTNNIGFIQLDGEHNRCELLFKLSDELAQCDYVTAEFATSDGAKHLRDESCGFVFDDAAKTLTGFMDAELAVEGLIQIQLVGYVVPNEGEAPQAIVKSPVINGFIGESINGVLAQGEGKKLLIEALQLAVKKLVEENESLNLNTLSKLFCEAFESGDGPLLTNNPYPERLQFNGNYLRYLYDGSVITDVQEIEKDGRNFLRMRLSQQAMSFGFLPGFIDIPVASIQPEIDTSGGLITNGSSLDLGVGITTAEINEDGELLLIFDSGRVENLGGVVGADGEDGADGIDGKSAYELDKQNGYTGTLEEWLEELHSTKPLPLINSTETSAVLEPNTAYSFGEAAELSLTLADGAENTLSEYIFSFISGETPTVLTLPADIIWANELTIEANKRYEINIANGFALWVCAEVSA